MRDSSTQTIYLELEFYCAIKLKSGYFSLIFLSCSICEKKQNIHFIVPHSSFNLLQVSLIHWWIDLGLM